MPTIKDWLQDAASQLKQADISSARLDAELILSHSLNRPRTYLHAHGEEQLPDRRSEIAEARLGLRINRTPLAYIIGHKEFYSRRFKVTPATLIPRPESETMIDILKQLHHDNLKLLAEPSSRLVDVGTGSGCLGITAKLELAELQVSLLDVSRHALNVAQKNADQLQAEVTCLKSNLLSNYPFKADYILANLPYVDPDWQRSPETNHEPELALFAGDKGLALIKQLLVQASNRLQPAGFLLLEADPRQHDAIIKLAKNQGFKLATQRDFILALSSPSPDKQLA